MPIVPADGHLRVQRIVEDIVESDEIWTRRILRVERIADKPGQTALGPWVVQSGESTAVTERVVVEAIGLDGSDASRLLKPEGLPASIPLMVPSSRFPENGPQFDSEIGAGAWVVVPADMVFDPAGSEIGPRMELRKSGQPVWTAKLIQATGPARVKRGGAVVIERR